ncbi:MAG TPA: type IX secretion system membrane protein PorP/SprF [candidate division Zixibacteria bacterium]|nr:type IX secretion system membrane protein PorP/SprF [candidate division Zixibacteria bacterium]
MKQYLLFISIFLLFAFATGVEGQSGSDPYINLIYPKVDPTYNSLLLDGYPASGIGSYATPQKPILLNPAAMATVPQTQVAFDHQRFFLGIGSELYSSSFVYAHHFLNRGIGLSFGHFGSEMMSMQSIGLHYGQRLISAANPRAETNRVGLYGGISLRMRRKGYNDANFRLADPGDPLLAGELSKTAFSGGFGITYQAETWRAFIIGDDLTSPNMALQEGVTDKLPMQIQAGCEVLIPHWDVRVNPVITYHDETGDFGKDIDPTLTLRKALLENQLDMSLSGGRWALGMGVYYFLGEESGPGFGYEVSIPTTGINNPSHRVALTYRFAPPPPAYPDIAVDRVFAEGTPIIGGDISIKAEISNEGVRSASNIPINLVSDGESLGIVRIDKLDPKESKIAEFTWNPAESGHYDFDIRADDEGGKYPEFQSTILELDKSNNTGSCSAEIHPIPRPVIDADPPNLLVTQLITVTEDEPVVPIIFFDHNDIEVNPRFDSLLSIVGRRLSSNPSSHIMIEGYFEETEAVDFPAGSTLAINRADRVGRKLIDVNSELIDRVRISEDHDFSRSRAEKEDFEGTRLGRIYTAQENRRVELRVYARPPRKWLLEGRHLSDGDYETIRDRLDNNDLFEVVCIAPTLDSAFTIKKSVADNLGPRYKDRVFAREAPGEEVKVTLTAGAILYRPRAFEVPSNELRVEPGFDKTNFECDPGTASKIQYSAIQVKDSWNETVWEIDDNKMIEKASWNWKGRDGTMISPEKDYFASLIVKDEFGQTGRSLPESLRVVKSNRKDLAERLILVQFTFAGAFGEPDYASVRMEKLSRKVVTRIAQDGSLRVVIGGHTDTIGVYSGNVKLSNRRAEEQYNTLRKYMMQILGLDNQDKLDAWLVSNNSVLSARGYGPSRPYTITRGKGESARQVVIGDNSLPEGRITNRRVEIEFMPLRE